jgi:hypothetical protein
MLRRPRRRVVVKSYQAQQAASAKTAERRAPPSVRLAVASIFAALIALGTTLSIPLPAPLYEITWSPAIYLALAVLSDGWTAFSATAIGGFVGEAYNVAFRGGGSPIYPLGMIWARGPEIFIVVWGLKKGGLIRVPPDSKFRLRKFWLDPGTKWVVIAMVIATVFETLAFFFPDWLFYSYGLFQYSVGANQSALGLALFDFGTLIDLIWIPVAFVIIYSAAPAFRRLGFQSNVQEPAKT